MTLRECCFDMNIMNRLIKVLLLISLVLFASCSGEKHPDVKQVFDQALHANTLQDQRDALIFKPIKNPLTRVFYSHNQRFNRIKPSTG